MFVVACVTVSRIFRYFSINLRPVNPLQHVGWTLLTLLPSILMISSWIMNSNDSNTVPAAGAATPLLGDPNVNSLLARLGMGQYYTFFASRNINMADTRQFSVEQFVRIVGMTPGDAVRLHHFIRTGRLRWSTTWSAWIVTQQCTYTQRLNICLTALERALLVLDLAFDGCALPMHCTDRTPVQIFEPVLRRRFKLSICMR